MSLQVKCEKGYYCTGGVRKKCPPGTFGLIEGAIHEIDASQPCNEGYFCPSPVGAPNVDEISQNACGACHLYCPRQSYTPLNVDTGYYSIGGDTVMVRTSQEICPVGHFCVHGVKYKCAAGKFGNATGLISR